jgi:hypothetical protein
MKQMHSLSGGVLLKAGQVVPAYLSGSTHGVWLSVDGGLLCCVGVTQAHPAGMHSAHIHN